MLRTQQDWQHDYLLFPNEYPISDNEAHSTYDQFIQLRDTLVMSNKYYADNAWRWLIIWVKTDWTPTDTIEIWKPNMYSQSFEPSGTQPDPILLGTYITQWTHTSTNPRSCEIVKDWRYVLQHKEQFKGLANSNITRILAYILQHDTQWWVKERAVFDWERSTAWEFNRITSFGYVECNLNKWDWLELKIVDQDDNDIPDSYLQQYSNRWMVEYKDLAYNI